MSVLDLSLKAIAIGIKENSEVSCQRREISNEDSKKGGLSAIKGTFGIRKISYQLSYHLSGREVGKVNAGL